MYGSMVNIQSQTAEIRRGKKEETTGRKYIWPGLLHRAAINKTWLNSKKSRFICLIPKVNETVLEIWLPSHPLLGHGSQVLTHPDLLTHQWLGYSNQISHSNHSRKVRKSFSQISNPSRKWKCNSQVDKAKFDALQFRHHTRHTLYNHAYVANHLVTTVQFQHKTASKIKQNYFDLLNLIFILQKSNR